MNITMLRIGTKAVRTYHPEYPALEMILIWQIRLKTNTKMKNTPKTAKKIETLWGNERQLLICPDTVVHCTVVSSCSRDSATRFIDSSAWFSIPGLFAPMRPNYLFQNRTIVGTTPAERRNNTQTTFRQRSPCRARGTSIASSKADRYQWKGRIATDSRVTPVPARTTVCRNFRFGGMIQLIRRGT
jgi:hypothetical protein